MLVVCEYRHKQPASLFFFIPEAFVYPIRRLATGGGVLSLGPPLKTKIHGGGGSLTPLYFSHLHYFRNRKQY